MELLDNVAESIASDKLDKIAELEDETKAIQKSNPYNISDELANNGFVNTYDALYRLYSTSNGAEYYLKMARDSGKKFKLNYSWCVKEDGAFNVVSAIFNTTSTIFENTEKRNKMLGKYTKDYNLPRSETAVANYLNETWQLIIGATDYLQILKDKNAEFNVDKYSSNSIMQEYLVLSDVVIDNDAEFRLLHAKGENYNLFMHNLATGEDGLIATFDWQDSPIELLKADESDAKIQLLFEKLTGINPSFDVFLIKDELFKSIVNLDKDMNKKMELLNNASSVIKDVLVDVIATLRTKHFDNLTENIKAKLSEHKAPSIQMLADYINASDEFFVVHDIKKKFKRTPTGFVEITLRDVSNFFNNEFGYNKISMKRCNECMDFITRELHIDYDVIQFKNGLYNTRTSEFLDGKFASEYIPKLNLSNFSYVEDAETKFKETDLYKENQAILETKRKGWCNWNETIFYKSIGSCYNGVNIADKLFVLVGKSWSRKSTLLTIIKRIFGDNYCNKKIQEIVKNERFVLVPTVNKAILIDDDASDLQIANIGNLNSFISGTGLFVEFKNSNDGVHLNENNTPRIWCASNTLFNVVGDGFKRRLCLILCDNTFSRDESSKEYMVAINNGERDSELELMISYCLQLFASTKDSAFLTKEQEDLMYDEFEFKSYAERRFVKDVFAYGDEIAEMLEDNPSKYADVNIGKWSITYQDNSAVESVADASDKETDANIPKTIPTIVPKKVATIICRKYFKHQLKNGTIFESQAIPSSKKIKTAMEMFGFSQTKKNVIIGGNRTTIDVFENAVIKQEWIDELGLENIVDKIVSEDL